MKFKHYIIVIFLIAIDQFSKSQVMHLSDSVYINQWFNIIFVKNFGITFGLFNRADEFVTRVIFSLMVTLIIIYLFIIAKRNADVYSPIIAGAIGNLIDRVHLGYVVDFLDFHIGNKHWPAFNVADSCVCVGVILLLFSANNGEKHEIH